MKSRWIRFSKIYGSILIIILIGIIALNKYASMQESKAHTYTFSADTLSTEQNGLLLTMDASKVWTDNTNHPSLPCGAQYDFTINNKSNHIFKDYLVEYTFDQDSILIDSSWNGEYKINGNTMTFYPAVDLLTIESSKGQGFGAVIYSPHLLTIESISVIGSWHIEIQDYSFYWIILTVSVISIFVFSIHLGILIRMTRESKRKELDSQIIEQSMNTLTQFIDAKDPYTKGHSIRVANYSKEIAKRLKFKEDDYRNLYYIALMHDCGKIGIPDNILMKPGRLSETEFEVIKQHTIIGDELLNNFTAIKGIRDGAHYHHERYDGSGYPQGLKGDEIPLYARIICVADSFDAMSSNRCYRPHLPMDKIITELLSNSGKQFAPSLVPIMIDMINDGFVDNVMTRFPITD